jgi:hypothetical protein
MSESTQIQYHSNVSAISKNPYAQRRTTTESLTQSSPQNRNINLLGDSTNVAAKPPAIPSQLHGSIGRDNDHVEDEMIGDYMEYDNDKPPDDYDPYIDDEFEVVVPSNQTIEHVLSPSTDHPSNRTEPLYREKEEVHNENVNDVEIVRQFQSRPKKDLYTFERYVRTKL